MKEPTNKETNKALLVATELYVMAKKTPNVNMKHIFSTVKKCTNNMPTMHLASAKWIARESGIKHLDSLELAKTILKAYRVKHPVAMVDPRSFLVECDGFRRCCRCREWKLMDTHYTEMDRMCKQCRKQVNLLRNR